ncbi:lytic transglycosylase domain-containing protein [Acinetobacter baumannii]|uniref:lytic transglycosylase domain-containing protein n=1 Tax=Acinetobacter baumannii TaxID=470 RepID=UPI0008DE15A6|nr:lytic transglycosylase domain-containing protein [Acinetobacter baumannii]MCE6930361.1 lytic transglycosylase domain-containing protein [Acinetobacter baumannii]MCZ0638418.1 lytic transglycosylase domain-containing protein [Acinetobacter baumannii]MVO43802.1 transglycosylase SLT domain-containing protein [Acinetobacter baumannii]OIB66645.1 murein transglycosylase [Acinetobacter baumannii]OIE94435.1 murein transglycosylase [Acinetobacter baumannii]
MLKNMIIGIFCSVPLFVYASPYEELINKHSIENGVDPKLTTAVMARESNFNPNARSSKNALGLMQVIPSTARLMGVDPRRLYDPEQNIIAGTRYLAFLSRRFNGDLTKVIAGYNAGHGAVEKFGGIPPYRETQNYVRYVSSKYLALNGGGTFQNFNKNNSEPKRPSNILVLSNWQQKQYPTYSGNSNESVPDTYTSRPEPVRLRANYPVDQNASMPQQASVQQTSFVKTLNNGQYVQVF